MQAARLLASFTVMQLSYATCFDWLSVQVDMAKTQGRRGLLRRMALSHSHPNWMVSRWMARWGEDTTRALLEHNNRLVAGAGASGPVT